MTLVVETGAGLPNADSYVSAAAAGAYATATGLTWPSDASLQEAALRRATTWIDDTYHSRFPGYRLNRRLQSLEWPRSGAYVPLIGGPGPSPSFSGFIDGIDPLSVLNQFDYLASDAVPSEIMRATIEAAVREAGQPGLLLGDVLVQGQVQKETAGDTSFQYYPVGGRGATTSGGYRFPVIDAILSGILVQQSGYTARAARG